MFAQTALISRSENSYELVEKKISSLKLDIRIYFIPNRFLLFVDYCSNK